MFKKTSLFPRDGFPKQADLPPAILALLWALVSLPVAGALVPAVQQLQRLSGHMWRM